VRDGTPLRRFDQTSRPAGTVYPKFRLAHASRDMDGWKGIHPLALITAPGLVARCSYLSTLRDIGVRDRFRA